MRGIVLAAVAALIAAGAAAQPKDPDWPCEQRKVTRLSMGQVWTGPIPEDPRAWREDEGVAGKAALIAARRTSMEEVGAVVAEVAAGPEPDARLTALFAGAFELIDDERARLVDGIVRYALKQRALAEKIDMAQVELAALQRDVKPDDFDALDRIDEMQDAVNWDVRIYDERRRSLQYVCESPVLLERRIFAIGRMIGERLGG